MIYVNDNKVTVPVVRITYDLIVSICTEMSLPDTDLLITYEDGPKGRPTGVLSKSKHVTNTPGMKFTAVPS